jgi:Universal stress protein UspA and related nucleotide-binding proteins
MYTALSKIVIASDGSEHSERAAKAAVDLAKRFGAELILVTVLEVDRAANSLFSPLQVSDRLDEVIHAAHDAQDRIEEEVEELAEAEGVPFRARRERGHPADRIVAVAKEEHADLIVVGARGLGAFAALLLGSVSSGVLHHAPCSVFVVK